jgi:benzylsuccinate CoA-transferase BbsF subunit
MEGLPLDGVRVTDLSCPRSQWGATCTRYLGLMGAEVVRIESRRRPDPYREGAISHLINQGEKSATLNLAHPKGVRLAKELVRPRPGSGGCGHRKLRSWRR